MAYFHVKCVHKSWKVYLFIFLIIFVVMYKSCFLSGAKFIMIWIIWNLFNTIKSDLCLCDKYCIELKSNFHVYFCVSIWTFLCLCSVLWVFVVLFGTKSITLEVLNIQAWFTYHFNDYISLGFNLYVFSV